MPLWPDTIPEPALMIDCEPMAEAMVAAPPYRLGPYLLLRVLGEGGVARVYEAEHSIIGTQVAIKTLLPQFSRCPEAHQMLVREARIAGAIRHPNLVGVYDFATDADGLPYFVMEIAAGETLAKRLERGPLLLSQSLDVSIRVGDAVAAVHAAGFLHRDIKSENVLLAASGRRLTPKLVDFGIATPIRTDPNPDQHEGMVGTPRTMAPEQIAQDAMDERTDIWALGVLLYEMLTGRLPFPAGETLREDLVAIVTEPPQPLPFGLPRDVRKIVEACLSKEPEQRPASAMVFVDQLRAARTDYLARHEMIERVLAPDDRGGLEAEELLDDLAA